jgi:hypothetical protein
MENINRISVEQCCTYYSIEVSFVKKLDEHGLIQLNQIDDVAFITHDQLPDLEKYMHLYYDLDINIEGIDTIRHMLYRMQQMQQQIARLQNLLKED